MDKTEIAAVIAIVYGLLEAVKLLTKALIDKKNGVTKPQPTYKHDFMEKLGEMMEAHAKILNGIASRMERVEPLILAVDPATNYPRIWSDSPQQKRTHDNVSNLVELQEEMVKAMEVKKHA
jgi:hypothetical protein